MEDVDESSSSVADESLAANATVEMAHILNDEEETDELQNENMVSLASSHISIDEEKIIATTLNEEEENFDEEGNEVKYNTLEKHECDICLRTYSSIQSLKTHKRSHQSEKSFQCETCFKCFSERSTLKRHMYIHLEEKPFKCEHCERAFSDKSTLRRHIITHTGAKRFQCSSCDKRFTRNEHLRQHNYIHTAQKLYKCDVCQKDFRQRSTLKNHMLLHRAEGGLKCEACNSIFSRQLQYDKHVRWCNGNANDGFKCEFCDKRFPERNSLKRHQLIHSGERPFKCDYCEQSFNDRSILRRHVFTHTEKKPFQCSVCEKEFIRKASLLTHMASQHADQSVFEFVEPTEYEMDDSIPIENEELEHVRYVIQSTGSTDSDDSISHLEVSANDIENDEGVTMLAHAVCSIPQNVLRSTTDTTQALVQNLNGEKSNKKESSQIMHIQVAEGSGIQSHDNQLLQVQIIRMEDGNQFVQSIQAIVQEEDKEAESIPLDTSQVLNDDEELEINTKKNNVVTEILPTRLTISEGINIASKINCASNNVITESAPNRLTISEGINIARKINCENNNVMTESAPTHLTISEGINICSNVESKPARIDGGTLICEFSKDDDGDNNVNEDGDGGDNNENKDGEGGDNNEGFVVEEDANAEK